MASTWTLAVSVGDLLIAFAVRGGEMATYDGNPVIAGRRGALRVVCARVTRDEAWLW